MEEDARCVSSAVHQSTTFFPSGMDVPSEHTWSRAIILSARFLRWLSWMIVSVAAPLESALRSVPRELFVQSPPAEPIAGWVSASSSSRFLLSALRNCPICIRPVSEETCFTVPLILAVLSRTSELNWHPLTAAVELSWFYVCKGGWEWGERERKRDAQKGLDGTLSPWRVLPHWVFFSFFSWWVFPVQFVHSEEGTRLSSHF